MTFAEKLARLTAGMNRAQLSVRAGLPKTAISDYLAKGNMPSAPTALRLAMALGVSLDWLVDESRGWEQIENRGSAQTEIRAAADVVRGEQLAILHRMASLLLAAQLNENKGSANERTAS